MARVLLKRPMRTPFGRYPQSFDGIPTEISDGAIAALRKRQIRAARENGLEIDEAKVTGLPSDAIIVGPDYKTPEQEREEARYDDMQGSMTAAEEEARINDEVNRRLAEMEKDALASKPAAKEDDDKDILDDSVPNIVVKLHDLDLETLQGLLEREQAGKTRSTLVAEIEAAIEDRQAE